jgi:hypothetical protein
MIISQIFITIIINPPVPGWLEIPALTTGPLPEHNQFPLYPHKESF